MANQGDGEFGQILMMTAKNCYTGKIGEKNDDTSRISSSMPMLHCTLQQLIEVLNSS